ncbi:hypothetical protein F383_06846 [Gossypium arboreum]|uniref:Uncharacterized protein n=1 Tax=Gossypium arboreum TaxID=29729 RepID=A0A0B0P5L1_GOSAR|nr:hypothetical protein F383_06846 [Gossypium arboreum]
MPLSQTGSYSYTYPNHISMP